MNPRYIKLYSTVLHWRKRDNETKDKKKKETKRALPRCLPHVHRQPLEAKKYSTPEQSEKMKMKRHHQIEGRKNTRVVRSCALRPVRPFRQPGAQGLVGVDA